MLCKNTPKSCKKDENPWRNFWRPMLQLYGIEVQKCSHGQAGQIHSKMVTYVPPSGDFCPMLQLYGVFAHNIQKNRQKKSIRKIKTKGRNKEWNRYRLKGI